MNRISPVVKMISMYPNNLFLSLAHTISIELVDKDNGNYYPIQEQIICALKYNENWWS